MPIYYSREHLKPQISQDKLQANTINNYKQAIKYYSQRREIVQNLLRKNSVQLEQEFETLTNNKIQELWETGVAKLALETYRGKGNLDDLKASLNKQLKIQIDQNTELENSLNKALMSGTFVEFYSNMGKAYEEFLPQYILNPVLETGSNFADAHLDQLLKAFSMGTKMSKSAVTAGNTFTRTDIGLSYTTSLKSSDGILKAGAKEVPVELQAQLSINSKNMAPKKTNYKRLIEQYCNQGNTDFFGFQVKRYPNLENRKWMQSSVIAASLNKIFNQEDKAKSRHAWQTSYIQPYIVYFLSHQLFEIINPVNIGMITGTGFLWMDQILSSHMFYMNVAIENAIITSAGEVHTAGENRIFPQIKDQHIYFSQKLSKLTSGFDAISKSRTKNKEQFITLKLKSK